MDSSHAQMVRMMWNIADNVLHDVFAHGQYRNVILPIVVLRHHLLAQHKPTQETSTTFSLQIINSRGYREVEDKTVRTE